MPRFQSENFETNVKLVKGLEKISQKKHCTPAQLALAWIRSLSNRQGMPKFIQIPGATTTDKAKDNAVEVELTEGELKDVDTILRSYEILREMYALRGVATIMVTVSHLAIFCFGKDNWLCCSEEAGSTNDDAVVTCFFMPDGHIARHAISLQVFLARSSDRLIT